MDARRAQHDDEQLIAQLAALDVRALARDGQWESRSRKDRLEFLTAQAIGAGLAFADQIAVSWSLCERVEFLCQAEGELVWCKEFLDCGALS